ncbi:MAG: Gx transporter family protein [Eubacteriales bacterium]|nr:Gx transporter family protein [Eubacteriales bacterium]
MKSKTICGTRKLVLLALMASIAIMLSILENLFPIPVPVPGIKPGLANVISLTAIIIWGFGEAVLIMLIRTMATAFAAGSLFMFSFSLAGGLLSICVMYFFHRKLSGVFNIAGVSIAGSIMHNIGQLAVAALVMKEAAVFSYLPVLMISGVLMGILTGISTQMILRVIGRTVNIPERRN